MEEKCAGLDVFAQSGAFFLSIGGKCKEKTRALHRLYKSLRDNFTMGKYTEKRSGESPEDLKV